MEIIYGGVHLTMLTVDEFVGESVYDDSGVDYIYTRYLVRGSCVVNGQAEVRAVAGPPVSYQRTGGMATPGDIAVDSRPPGLPAPPGPNRRSQDVNLVRHADGVFYSPTGAGVFGLAPPAGIYARGNGTVNWFAIEPVAAPTPITDAAIRRRLKTPRNHLFVFANDGNPGAGELLLRSPVAFDVHADARNGPTPRAWGFRRALGDGADTLFCEFEVETCLTEVEETNYTATGPLLSNRWSATHRIDPTGIVRIDTVGKALFRTDWLYGGSVPGSTGFSVSPDDFRINIFQRVPFGFVRESITARGLPDVTGIEYAYTDAMQPVHFPAGVFAGASRISAVHTQAIVSDDDILTGGAALFDKFVNRKLNTKWATDGTAPSGRDGDLASSLKDLAAALKGLKP